MKEDKKIIFLFLLMAVLIISWMSISSLISGVNASSSGEKNTQDKTEIAQNKPRQTETPASNGNTLAEYNQALRSGKPILLEFYSDGCGACKMLAPTLKELKETWKDKVVFIFADVTKPEFQELAQKNNVRAIPTMNFISKEGKVVNQVIGVREKSYLESELKKISQ